MLKFIILYDMLKKSNENDDNFTNFTIQLDVKNIN